MTDIHSATCKHCRTPVFVVSEVRRNGAAEMTTMLVCSKASFEVPGNMDNMKLIRYNEYPPPWCPYKLEITMWQDGICSADASV
jgi:hypothetical protein